MFSFGGHYRCVPIAFGSRPSSTLIASLIDISSLSSLNSVKAVDELLDSISKTPQSPSTSHQLWSVLLYVNSILSVFHQRSMMTIPDISGSLALLKGTGLEKATFDLGVKMSISDRTKLAKRALKLANKFQLPLTREDLIHIHLTQERGTVEFMMWQMRKTATSNSFREIWTRMIVDLVDKWIALENLVVHALLKPIIDNGKVQPYFYPDWHLAKFIMDRHLLNYRFPQISVDEILKRVNEAEEHWHKLDKQTTSGLGNMYQLPSNVKIEAVETDLQLEKLQNIFQKEACIVAADCEWTPCFFPASANMVSIMQLAVLRRAGPTTVYLIDMDLLVDNSNDENNSGKKLLNMLKTLFQSQKILTLGYGFEVHDISSLASRHPTLAPLKGLKLQNILDISHLKVKSKDPKTNEEMEKRVKGGLRASVQYFLKSQLDKRCQLSSWHVRPLSNLQIQYAACDVYCCIEILKKATARKNVVFPENFQLGAEHRKILNAIPSRR